MSRARTIRRATACALAALVVGTAAWFFGMDAPHAIGLAAVVLALTAVPSLLGDQADVTWPVPTPSPRPGARREVVQLGWSLGARGGRVSPEAVRRLRGLAADVLERSGVDLDDPAAAAEVERALGPGAAGMLRRGSAATPRPAEFAALLARLEGMLGAPAAHAVASASPPPEHRSPVASTSSTAPEHRPPLSPASSTATEHHPPTATRPPRPPLT